MASRRSTAELTRGGKSCRFRGPGTAAKGCHDVEVKEDLGRWKPLSPAEVSDLLAKLDSHWWIAGGWAIDLHLGEQTRAHDDIDVLILRDDQSEVQRHLSDWDLHAADPPGTLRPWTTGEVLPAQVHDIWCRPRPASSWWLQLMICDASRGEWVYRRDSRIRLPLADLDGPASDVDHRVLTPEVQLLYKSKNPRAKDEADFQAVRTSLDASKQRWLAESLALVSPGHHWLNYL